MKILLLLALVGIGIFIWKVVRAKTEFPPYDMVVEEDYQVMIEEDRDTDAHENTH